MVANVAQVDDVEVLIAAVLHDVLEDTPTTADEVAGAFAGAVFFTAAFFAAGKRVANPPEARSICDALQAAMPGEVTFPVNLRLLAGASTLSDDEVRAAMRAAFSELKLVLEPSGAAALAAALAGRVPGPNRAVCVIASGGNVDPALFAEVLHSA